MLTWTNYGLPQDTRFCDIWSTVDDFMTDYKASGIYANGQSCRLDDEHATLLYYLLYSRYGDNEIAAIEDRNIFKYNTFSIIFQYGPTWVKRLEIQDKLRKLTDTELMTGAKAIYNHAYNPGTAPSTGSLEELTAINEQNTSMFKKSPLEGYTLLLELLDTDVTGDFLNKFKKLFSTIQKRKPLLFDD